jgi:hypothetical protein
MFVPVKSPELQKKAQGRSPLKADLIPADGKIRQFRIHFLPALNQTVGIRGEDIFIEAGISESGKQTAPENRSHSSPIAMKLFQKRKTPENPTIWETRKRMAPTRKIIHIFGITALRMLNPVKLPTTVAIVRTPIVKSEHGTGRKRQKNTGDRIPLQGKDRMDSQINPAQE